MQGQALPPVSLHAKMDDLYERLSNVRKQFDRALHQLSPDSEGEESKGEVENIGCAVVHKIGDLGDVLHDIEVLANKFESRIGTVKDQAAKVGRGSRLQEA